jgi:hypothetical protein
MRGWLNPQEHLTEEELFLVFDASLSRDRSERMQAHLGQCWECKTKLEQWDAARSDYMFYKSKFQDSVTPPPSNWASFQSQLNRMSEELNAHDQSDLRRQFQQFLQRMIQVPYLRSVRVGLGASVLVIVVLAVVARWNIPTVSASDVLRRAEAHEHSELVGLKQPVIYQKLAIKVGGRAFARTIYRDVRTPRRVDRIEGAEGQPYTVETAHEVTQVEEVFLEAKLDWQAPLSPSRFDEWRSSARSRSEDVVRSGGVTKIRAIMAEGPILEAAMTFRNSDFHPVAETLSLKDKQNVEIAELDYGVVELSQLNPGVFDPVYLPLAAVPAPKLALGPAILPSPVDLELDALTRLDQVDALLKDQINVSRTGDGEVLIEGVVETPERRAELFQVLASVVSAHNVRSDIRTVDEVEERQALAGPLKLDSVDVLQRQTPAQESLRRYLMSRGFAGEKLDPELQAYTYRIFDHSNGALVNAVLVKQIANTFTESEILEMNEEARAKWAGLIERHAETVIGELVDLRSELQPAFSPQLNAGHPATQPSDVARAAAELSEVVAGIDKDIGKSLAISPSGVNDNSLGTEKFWHTFSRAEELAYAIVNDAKRQKQ